MAKTREYDYDKISKKLTKSAPKVIKAKDKSTAEAMGDIYDMMGRKAPKAAKKPKKYTYVPESTDTDANMEDTTAEDVFLPFQAEINDIAQKSLNTRAYKQGKKTLKEVVFDNAMRYLQKQKEYRQSAYDRRRQAQMAAQFADVVMEETEQILKRKRIDTPPNSNPTSAKPATKRAARRASLQSEGDPSVARALFQSDESSDDEETKEEKRLRKLNPGIKKVYDKMIDDYTSMFGKALYKDVGMRFQDAVNLRKGKQYYKHDAPKPPTNRRMTQLATDQYKKELKGWLDGIFI